MKTRSELDSKVKELKEHFGNDICLNGNVYDLEKFFDRKFNYKIIKRGTRGVFDFTKLMKSVPEISRMFNDDPIQPFTVTYVRQDIIFYKLDKNPKEEKYIQFGAAWTHVMYLNEIKQSELFKKKEYLKKKDPEEWYIQVNLFDIKNKYTTYIRDIDFNDYS